jgi:hypothetical protein
MTTEQCAICSDDMDLKNDDIEFLQCFHRFHSKCITRWILVKPQCPICKFCIGLDVINVNEDGEYITADGKKIINGILQEEPLNISEQHRSLLSELLVNRTFELLDSRSPQPRRYNRRERVLFGQIAEQAPQQHSQNVQVPPPPSPLLLNDQSQQSQNVSENDDDYIPIPSDHNLFNELDQELIESSPELNELDPELNELSPDEYISSDDTE